MTRFNPASYAKAIAAAKEHARECWPNESCGAILTDGTYQPFNNVAANPKMEFNCHEERLPFLMAGRLVAMVHSHPYEASSTFRAEYPPDFGPSAHDMRSQLSDDIPWGLIATNGLICVGPFFWGRQIEDVPILGRQFRHGPTGTDRRGDCYALIKDFYRMELNIDLPEGPRSPDWWHAKENLYLENMERAGFKNVPASEAKPGDVFFAQVNSSVPNHGGVLLEGGLIVHHLSNRVSRQESLVGWRKHIVRWIRHEKRDQPS